MIKKVVGVKDKRLRAKSTKIKSLDKKTLSLINDLKETLLAQTDPEGVGLAAPQIGVNKKVFAMKPKDKIKIVINPKIISIEKIAKEPPTKTKNVMEGCLSLPHYYSPIRKPDKVTITYRNEKWEKKTETFTGFNAQIIQHEVDHLEGKLFIDHVFSQNKPLYKLSDVSGRKLSLYENLFFGTPNYVIPVLDALHKYFKKKGEQSAIAAVVTQTPKPAGRKKILEYSDVDHWAHKHNIPKFYSSKEFLESKIKADIGVLASFGQIIPKSALDYFPHGIVNIHPSLLPEFRGASPVQATIVTGQKITGSTFIKLDEELDHGPILGQFKEEVKATDTTESLRNRLFDLSADMLPKLLEAYMGGKTKPKAQDHKKATFTKQVKKSDGFIDLDVLKAALEGKPSKDAWEIPFIKNSDGSVFTDHCSPITVHRLIRAMHPWPGVWTLVELNSKHETRNPKRLKIHEAHLEESTINNQQLIIDVVQLEGKNPVSWEQFKQAYRI